MIKIIKVVKFWTVDDSEHCEIWRDYNQEYCDKLESFLGYSNE